MLLLAQGAAVPTIAHWILVGIVLAGIVGIAIVVIRATNVPVPSWFVQILWIVLVVVVAVVAIKFILSVV